jgi:hypothetical protein
MGKFDPYTQRNNRWLNRVFSFLLKIFLTFAVTILCIGLIINEKNR